MKVSVTQLRCYVLTEGLRKINFHIKYLIEHIIAVHDLRHLCAAYRLAFKTRRWWDISTAEGL